MTEKKTLKPIVSTVQESAHKAIEQVEIMRLSQADQVAFAQALITPPEPDDALDRAFERRRQLLQPE